MLLYFIHLYSSIHAKNHFKKYFSVKERELNQEGENLGVNQNSAIDQETFEKPLVL